MKWFLVLIQFMIGLSFFLIAWKNRDHRGRLDFLVGGLLAISIAISTVFDPIRPSTVILTIILFVWMVVSALNMRGKRVG